MIKHKLLLLLFLILVIPATLFPPFNWGEERLQTESEKRERLQWGQNVITAQEFLPIKRYAFLFGASIGQFSSSDSGTGPIETSITLRRKMIVSELLLEYLLAFILAYLIYITMLKRRNDKHQ
jgi:hypothetical protein